jgi:RNA-binding protein 39
MQRLAATAGISGPAPSQVLQPAPAAKVEAAVSAVSWDQGFLGPASPIPTPCLLLKNMFDPAQEEIRARDEGAEDPANDWVKEVEVDVQEECSRFGEVKHIFLDRISKGFVYVKFADQHGASAAHRALNGRFYSGKQILVDFQFEKPYGTHFAV